MGTASRALLIIFRVGELACGAIVIGLLGRLFYLLDQAGVIEPNGRLIYAAVVAGITILQSLIFIVPLPFAYWIWPLDFTLFVAWIVAFSLLISLTGGDTCSGWFNDYWGYYWGGWYLLGPSGIDVNMTGCPAWRGTLAFSFIAAFIYLVSGFLGVYWTLEYGNLETRTKAFVKRRPQTLQRRRGPATKPPMTAVTPATPITPAPHETNGGAHTTTSTTAPTTEITEVEPPINSTAESDAAARV